MPRRRRRQEESESSSEGESDSQTTSDEESGTDTGSDNDSSYDDSSSDGSDSDESGSDSDSESESDSEAEDTDDDDYTQLLDVLNRNGLKSVGKKLISNKIYTVVKAREIPASKLVKKYGISASDAKSLKKLLNDPHALLPPASSDSEDSQADANAPSDDEDEKVWRVLRSIDEGNLIKAFKKEKILSLKQAYRLTDKKLKKLGVEDKDLRDKILHEFKKKKDNATSSEEDEEVKLAKILKAVDMKPYIKNLQKGKITDLDGAYNLKSSTLKSLGIVSKKDRKIIMKEISKYKASHAEEDPSLALVKKALTQVGLRKYYIKLKQSGVDSIKKLKKIEHKELRDLGIQVYKERKEMLEKIEKIGDNGEVDIEDPSFRHPDQEDNDGNVASDDDNVVNEVLRSQYMSRHIPDFKRSGIKDLKQARKLTQTQLRSMGVALYLDREKLINAFADYRPKNPTIMRILQDLNLSKHAPEFEKLSDIDEAKLLTHADLRAMGISLYGQRDRVIKAFASYEDDKASKGSKKKRRSSSTVRRRKAIYS